MIITNKQNLPEAFLKYATEGNREYKEHRYSVTELLLPVREILLNRKHAHEIESDVSDTIPALFGTAVHNILEQYAPILETDVKAEESVEAVFGDDIVAGRIDLLNLASESIEDYKTCSVSKVMKQDFEDWRLQGLAYALLVFKQKGIIIRHLKFYALMKDWSKIKSATASNYPASAVYIWKYDIQDSDYDYIEEYLKAKLRWINECIEIDDLPECTNEEKWYTGTKYAVYKNVGDKKAAIVCDTEEEAHGFITNKCGGSGEIEVRKGEYLKCKYYCNCCKFCEKRGE